MNRFLVTCPYCGKTDSVEADGNEVPDSDCWHYDGEERCFHCQKMYRFDASIDVHVVVEPCDDPERGDGYGTEP